jgi:hypothetical protein
MRPGGRSKNVGARGLGGSGVRRYSEATGANPNGLLPLSTTGSAEPPNRRAREPRQRSRYCLISCPRITPEPLARVCTLK